MFFTTFNIKAEINRIIFVFSLSLPEEKSNEGFRNSGLPTQPPHKLQSLLQWSGAEEALGMCHPSLQGPDVPRSHFMRIPHRPQTSSPKSNEDSFLKMLCIDLALFPPWPRNDLASLARAHSRAREEMLTLPFSYLRCSSRPRLTLYLESSLSTESNDRQWQT